MILLVESKPTIRQLLKGIIHEHLDHPLIEAACAKDMIAQLNRVPVHLLVMGTDLEDMDSLEIVRKIRVKHSIFDLPIILIVSSSQLKLIAKAFAYHVNDCLALPCEPTVAAARIKAQLYMIQEYKRRIRDEQQCTMT